MGQLPEPLSQRVRRLLRLLKPYDDLLVHGRSDSEAVFAQRPHLDGGALDPKEGPRSPTARARDRA